MTGDGFSHNHQVNMTGADEYNHNQVNFGPSRSLGTVLKSKFIETFFPDYPFRQFKGQPAKRRVVHALKYFVPIFGWLSEYKLTFFTYDLIAGITIASMAIPQGISYANLAQLPPIIGLYSAFVPPLIYGVFGSSMNLAVGTVAACSLLIADEISGVASPTADTYLYVSLVFTATLFSGVLQLLLGLFRLGILVDFLSHSTITGFMGGTALLIILQQFKGLLALKHFTRKTGVVNVITAILHNRNEWRWQCFLIGMAFLVFLQITRYIRTKNPKLFYVSAMGPIVVVIVGCLMTYLSDVEKMGVSIVGTLHKGLPSLSTNRITFDSRYLSAPIKAGLMTGLIALAEGIAIGRSFAIQKNQQIDGNKEMVAFGLMNIVGSLTSCYLTTGPFSKTAVNVNAGCKTPMTNIVQSVCMLLVLLFLAPIFSYTPQVALSAIIISAMLGLIKYEEYWHLFKTDKFDFIICMSAFFGVSFISMDMGLMISVGLSLIRALLYIARPATCKLGNIPQSNMYRDIEQYPDATVTPGFLALQLGSPIYFANSTYIKERILRWVRDEVDAKQSSDEVEYVLLDLGGVTAIDITGVEALTDSRRMLASKGITMILVNPRIDVMEKLIITNFVDKIGRDNVFLQVEDAIDALRYKLKSASKIHGDP